MLDDPDIAYNHGVCLSEMGRTADAIPPLHRCVQLDPYYTHAHIALGVALAREGRADEAARALRIAIEQEPDDVFAVRNLAGVLANARKLDEALPLFRRAVDLQPADPVLRFGLARACRISAATTRGRPTPSSARSSATTRSTPSRRPRGPR
jgi:Flp pilus assembly protein TadD